MLFVKKNQFFKHFCIFYYIFTFVLLASVLGSWIYGGFFASLPFFYQDGFILEGFATSCTFNFIDKNFQTKIIVINMFIFGFLIPVITLTIFYFLLFFEIRRYSRYKKVRKSESITNSRAINREISYTTQARQCVTYGATNDSRAIRNISSNVSKKNPQKLLLNNGINKIFLLSAEVKIIKTSIIIVVSFCLSWLPYSLVALISQFSENPENFVTPLSLWLATIFAKGSAVHNPLIYIFLSKRFRKKCLRFYQNLKRICFHR
jgi:hypothetical protein